MIIYKKLNELALQHNLVLPDEASSKVNNHDTQGLVKPALSQRELLIALLLLQGKTHPEIADYLGLSISRVGKILARVCRRKFGVTGGGARFRQLFVEGGYYNQMPSTELLKHLNYSESN